MSTLLTVQIGQVGAGTGTRVIPPEQYFFVCIKINQHLGSPPGYVCF